MTMGNKQALVETLGDHGNFAAKKVLNRVENAFTWAPCGYSSVKLPRDYQWNHSHCKRESRIPLFWLARKGQELYFVNNSDEILDVVSTHTGGCETCDNEVVRISDDVGFTYRSVKPNEAVKVDEYDEFYDLEYLLQLSLRIESKTQGCINILTRPAKGSIEEVILLWNTGESGDVTITPNPMF